MVRCPSSEGVITALVRSVEDCVISICSLGFENGLVLFLSMKIMRWIIVVMGKVSVRTPALWWTLEHLTLGCNFQINPKQPDWIHRESKEALWIESATTPPWVRNRLAAFTQVQASPAETPVETQTLGDDEVGSTDHDFQGLATVEPM